MLGRGIVPLHGSAVGYKGFGILATGWSKGGKTETLLALAANGGRYIADEWVYISRNGEEMFGLPQPIRVWEWHLEHLPQIRSALGARARSRLWALKRIVNALEGSPLRSSTAPRTKGGATGKLIELMRRQMGADIAPSDLFGNNLGPLRSSVDHVLFVCCHESPTVSISHVDSREVARRMVSSVQHERSPLLACYRKFRFAFPGERNELIESAEELEMDALERSFRTVPAHAVCHPYPVPIGALLETIRPLLDPTNIRKAGLDTGCARDERILNTVNQ
jgi:hypothetical protein